MTDTDNSPFSAEVQAMRQGALFDADDRLTLREPIADGQWRLEALMAEYPYDPPALLSEVAEMIERHADGTTPGPWWPYNDYGLVSVDSPALELPVCADASRNGAWIAMMSPALATRLAAVLRTTAATWRTGATTTVDDAVLDLARTIQACTYTQGDKTGFLAGGDATAE